MEEYSSSHFGLKSFPIASTERLTKSWLTKEKISSVLNLAMNIKVRKAMEEYSSSHIGLTSFPIASTERLTKSWLTKEKISSVLNLSMIIKVRKAMEEYSSSHFGLKSFRHSFNCSKGQELYPYHIAKAAVT